LIAKAKSHQIGVRKLQNIHISIKFGILAVFFGFDAKRLFCKGFFSLLFNFAKVSICERWKAINSKELIILLPKNRGFEILEVFLILMQNDCFANLLPFMLRSYSANISACPFVKIFQPTKKNL